MNTASFEKPSTSTASSRTIRIPRPPPPESLIRSEFESLLSESSDECEGNRDDAIVTEPNPQTNAVPGVSKNICNDVDDEIILSMIWNNNRLGAAYYNVLTSELYVMEDIHEDCVQFNVTKALYRQCRPHYLLTITGASSSKFVNELKKLIVAEISTESSLSASTSSDQTSNTLLKLMSGKEANYERCYHRVRCLRLESEPVNASNEERITFLNTVINFTAHAMVHALGSLLLFVDKHWSSIALDRSGRASFVALNYVMLRDLVMVDENTYRALNIVQSRNHPSFFKFGNATAKTQGSSLFTLLNRCRSRPGMHFLWKTMQHPTRNIGVLGRRLEVIEFFMEPSNHGVVENVSSCLKHVSRLTNTILSRCSGPQAKPSDWYKLHKTVSHVIYIADICGSHAKIELFDKIAKSITDEMQYVKYFIEYIVDFAASRRASAFVVKPNVDPLLDELNHLRSTLPRLLTEMGERDMHNHLPPSVTGCNMLYLPNIGYVLAVKEWNPTPPEAVDVPGLEFKFTINGVHYYKSPSARELDDEIGDVMLKITKRQSQIMIKLIRYINKHAGEILSAIQLCAELDTLLAFYTVAREYNYIKPRIVESQVIAVTEGRHPLQECSTSFVPNDIRSGNGGSLVKILTGPNSCGKSVYLKQIGLIVFMAHIGCYVPAKSATIGIVTHILTQILTTDSIALNASTFLQDLRQINTALYASTPNSLILIDEFGKGTSEISGLSLLAAVLKSFVDRAIYCPHVFAATHIHGVLTLLPKSELIEAQTFEYVANEGDSLALLYRLTEGSTNRSFAHSVARSAGLDEDVVKRSQEVFEKLKRGQLPSRLPVGHRANIIQRIMDRLNVPNGEYDLQELKFLVREAVNPILNRL